MFKGPTGPKSGRTPRAQAERIGTDPSGFDGMPGYFPQGGYPITPTMPAQPYNYRDADPLPSGGSNFDPSPFTVK
jgi:hypothetical protein